MSRLISVPPPGPFAAWAALQPSRADGVEFAPDLGPRSFGGRAPDLGPSACLAWRRADGAPTVWSGAPLFRCLHPLDASKGGLTVQGTRLTSVLPWGRACLLPGLRAASSFRGGDRREGGRTWSQFCLDGGTIRRCMDLGPSVRSLTISQGLVEYLHPVWLSYAWVMHPRAAVLSRSLHASTLLRTFRSQAGPQRAQD